MQELLFNYTGDSPTLEGMSVKKRALAKQIKKEGTLAVAAFFKEFFVKYGHIVSAVNWTQFTPYFCDGEPCYFGYCGFSDSEDDIEYINEGSDPCPWDTKEGQEAYTELCKLDSQLDNMEDVLEWIFGDHIAVKVTVDGVTTSDYTEHY